MAQLQLSADEWSALIRAARAAAPDPHLARALSALETFFAPVGEARETAGDPRGRDAAAVVCIECNKPVTTGENFVFEPATGATYHSLCWLRRRVGQFAESVADIRDSLKPAHSERRGLGPEALEALFKTLDALVKKKHYLLPEGT